MKKTLLIAISVLAALCSHAELITADNPEVIPTIPGYEVTRIVGPDQLQADDKVLIRIHNGRRADQYLMVNSNNKAVGTAFSSITNIEAALFDVEIATGLSYSASFPAPYNTATAGTKYYKFKHGDGNYLPLYNTPTGSIATLNADGSAARLYMVTSIPALTYTNYTCAAEANTNGFFMLNYKANYVAYAYQPSGTNAANGFNGEFSGASGTSGTIYYNASKNNNVNNATTWGDQYLTPFFIFYRVTKDCPEITNAMVTRVTDVDELNAGDKVIIRIHNDLHNPAQYLAVNGTNQVLGTTWGNISNVNNAIFTVEAETRSISVTLPAPYNNATFGTKFYKFRHGDSYMQLAGSVDLAASSTSARLTKVTSIPGCSFNTNKAYNFAPKTDNNGIFMLNYDATHVAYCYLNNSLYGFNGAFGFANAGGTWVYYNSLKNAVQNGESFAQNGLTPFFKIYKVDFKADHQAEYDAACEYFEAQVGRFTMGNFPGGYTSLSGLDAMEAAMASLREYWETDGEFNPTTLAEKIQAVRTAGAAMTPTGLFNIHSINGPALVRIAVSDGYAAWEGNNSVNMRGNKYYLSDGNNGSGANVTTDAASTETIYLLQNNDSHTRCSLINYASGHALKATGFLGTSASDNEAGSVLFTDRTANEIGTYAMAIYNAAGTGKWCTVWGKLPTDTYYFNPFSSSAVNSNIYYNWDVKYVTTLTEGEAGVKTLWRAPVALQVAEGDAYTLHSDVENEKIISTRTAAETTYPAGTAFALKGVVKFNVCNNATVEAHALAANTLGAHAKHSMTLVAGEKYLSTHPLIQQEQEVMLMALDDEEENAEEDDNVVAMKVYGVTEDTTVEVPAHTVVLKASNSLTNGGTLNVELDKETLTSISEISADRCGEDAIYDLQGRRLAKPAKGAINIINGKKTFVY